MQSLEKSSSSIDGDPKFILSESSAPFSLFNVSLPLEMEMKIFSYLNAKDLCVASQVNQAWNALSQENSLWKELCREEIEKEKCPHCYRERNEGIDDDIRDSCTIKSGSDVRILQDLVPRNGWKQLFKYNERKIHVFVKDQSFFSNAPEISTFLFDPKKTCRQLQQRIFSSFHISLDIHHFELHLIQSRNYFFKIEDQHLDHPLCTFVSVKEKVLIYLIGRVNVDKKALESSNKNRLK